MKVGDKVKYLGGDVWAKDANCNINEIYTIARISDSSFKVIENEMGYWLGKQYFELVKEPKLIKKEEKVMAKQDYRIEGSKALRQAFVEECGLTPKSDDTLQSYDAFTSSNQKPKTVRGAGKMNLDGDKAFTLPQQWDEAVKYVNDFYKPEVPKVKNNDWVYILTDYKVGYKKIGDVFQITRVDGDYLYFEPDKSVTLDRVRLATPSEIKEVTIPKFKMADYESNINKEEKTISFGCQTYTKNEVKLLIDAAKLCASVGRKANVTANGFTVNISDTLTVNNLETILKLIK